MATLVLQTEGSVIEEVLRLLGDLVQPSTLLTAVASTTVFTIGNVPVDAIAANDDLFNNLWGFFTEGVSAGDERLIKDYDGGNRNITIAPAATTLPDTTTGFLISRRFKPSEVQAAVRAAVRRLILVIPTPLVDASHMISGLVHDPSVEYWDSSSVVSTGNFIYTRYVSDGWKVLGTGAVARREATIVRNASIYSQFSAKITSDGTNEAYIEWLVPDWARYAGLVASFEGWVYGSTGSRFRIRVDDGVTQHVTGDHSATTKFEKLTKSDITISAAATKLGIQAYIVNGNAQTAYFDDVNIFPSQYAYQVRVPAPFAHVVKLLVESGTEGVFNVKVPTDYWNLRTSDDGRVYIEFDPGIIGSGRVPTLTTLGGILTRKRRLLIEGHGYRTDTFATTTNIEISPQLVAYEAARELAMSASSGDSPESAYYSRRSGEFRAYADELLSRLPKRRPTNSRLMKW